MNSRLAPEKTQLSLLVEQGLALHQQGQFAQAIETYQQILSIQADHLEALYLLGTVLVQIKDYSTALEFLFAVLKMSPNHPEVHHNAGIALKELQRFEEALASYDQAIRLNPKYVEAYYNRGIVLKELNRLNESVESYSQAISIKADYADAYNNRGIVLLELNRFEEALQSFEQVILYQPNNASAYNNRGLALHELQRLEEAVANYEKAIMLHPQFAEAYWNLSLCNLLKGNFKQGWQNFEWRWRCQSFSSPRRNFSEPLWLGTQSLHNRNLLLYAEQGLGDTIQFCRYVPLVAKLGAKVILEVQRPLVKLLKNLEGVHQIISIGDKLPIFDYQCPLLSLPDRFKTELNTIPEISHQIISDPNKIATWRNKLGTKSKFRVGIVWSGKQEYKNDLNRSLIFSQIIPYLSPHAEYICLQKEMRDIDKESFKQYCQIRYLGNELEDFTDTAGLVENMDLVISVDTSVAHLAASLNIPTWILLSYSPDWRWLLERDSSPWYKSVKLYRQEKIGDWDGVLKCIKTDLESIIHLE